MSAARIETSTPPAVPGKVVPLNHHFGHEEQLKNTDQGNIAVSRSRKHPLPASDLAKVPAQTDIEKQIALAQQQLSALSPGEREAFLAKLKASLSTIQEQFPQLVKALSSQNAHVDSTHSSDPAGDKDFNPWSSSILMLYTKFATNQMNQNGQVMNGWSAQQEAQNQTLQAAADAESKNASMPTSTKQPSLLKLFFIGLATFVGALTAIALISTGVGAGLGILMIGGIAALATAAVVGACYGAAKSNPNSGANAGMVEEGPDSVLLQTISFANQFWSTISQKTNNQISSGSQTNLVNASSNSTQIGQQAAQVIQSMGQIMQTPVGH
jgi:hypothetical protein